MTPAEADAADRRARPHGDRGAALRVALWGGLGVATGVSVYRFTRFAYHEAGPVAFGFALLFGAFFVNFIEPQLRRRFYPEAEPTEHRGGRGVWGVAVGALLGLAFELIHAGFSHDVLDFSATVVISLFTFGTVTYCWGRSAARRPARAARYGAIAGFVATYAFLVLSRTMSGELLPSDPIWRELPVSLVLAETSRQVFPDALIVALYGLAGGLVIDRRWLRPSLAPVAAAFVLSLLSFVTSAWPLSLNHLGHLAGIGGWAVGLFVCPDTEVVLAGERPPSKLQPDIVALAVVLVVLHAGVVYRWLPGTLRPLYSGKLASTADWRGTCFPMLSPGGLKLESTKPFVGCYTVMRAFESIGGHVIIDVDLSAKRRDAQAYALVFLDERGSRYELTVFPGQVRLFVEEDGKTPPATLLAVRSVRPPSHDAVDRLMIEIRGRLMRWYFNGVYVGSFRTDGAIRGALALRLDHDVAVHVKDVTITERIPSLSPI